MVCMQILGAAVLANHVPTVAPIAVKLKRIGLCLQKFHRFGRQVASVGERFFLVLFKSFSLHNESKNRAGNITVKRMNSGDVLK